MNIEDMKLAWRDTTRSLEADNSADRMINEFKNGNPRTSLDRLRDRYRRFATAALCMMPVLSVFMNRRIFPEEGGVWLSVAFAVYFLIAAMMDWWLYKGVGSIDPLTMPVSEVISRAMYYRKKHLTFVVILIPMAIAIIIAMARILDSDPYLILGMAVGGAIGLAIGSLALKRFLDDYRNIS